MTRKRSQPEPEEQVNTEEQNDAPGGGSVNMADTPESPPAEEPAQPADLFATGVARLEEGRGMLVAFNSACRHEHSHDFIDRAMVDLDKILQDLTLGMSVHNRKVTS